MTIICKNCGEQTEESSRRGWCKPCKVQYHIEWRATRTEEQQEAQRTKERGKYARMTEEQKQIIRDRDKARYAANPAIKERIMAYNKVWLPKHPEVWRTQNRKRRNRIMNAEGFHTAAESKAIFDAWDNKCAYCKTATADTEDHMVPLVRGGTDLIENIVPACRSCNSRKHTKTAREFLELV